ncbi:5'-nucleotidase C-terminal domain-containing protein [Ruminococcaceae bacterium OttesenSCG-928-I18]|nr:5'-nucleotidase C-terminal domain-containing protein [Ruminococcaceae bacterium OttesenSCG-928-I18]
MKKETRYGIRKLVGFAVSLCLLLSLSVTAFAAAPLLEEEADLSGQVVILHTNDVHGHVDDNMGYAAVGALKKAYEEAGAEVLLLDAGDTFHGMPFATLNQGGDIPNLLNAVGYDAMTAGNHDFNYGQARLQELVEMLDFPLVSANILVEETGEGLFEDHIVVEKGGKKFGIFGLGTPETTTAASPEYTEGLRFADPIEVAGEQVAALQEQGVDYIIALTHLGVDPTSEVTADGLAADVPGIDLIIDGHSHTEMEQGVPLEEAEGLEEHGDTLIASAGSYLENIGVITLDEQGTFDAQLVSADDFDGKDEEITAIIEDVNEAQSPILDEVIGETPVLLEGEKDDVRTRETNLGNFTADAILQATGADVTFMNGGSIRASIEAGEITRRDIITVYPFGNYLLTKEIDGATLLQAMEHAVAEYPESSPCFPQIGGMTFTLDASAEAGSRVQDLAVGGQSVEEDKTYICAMDDYLAFGGDDFSMLVDPPMLQNFGALEEALVAYVQSGPVYPEEAEGRITLLQDADVSSSGTESASAQGEDSSAVSSVADEGESGVAAASGEPQSASGSSDGSSVSTSLQTDATPSDTESASAPEGDSSTVSSVAGEAESAASVVSEEPQSVSDSAAESASSVSGTSDASAPAQEEEEPADEEVAEAEPADEEVAEEEPGDEEEHDSTYTVKSGDSLWTIAEALLGDGNRCLEIYELNQMQILDPNLIYPGQVFQLPAA